MDDSHANQACFVRIMAVLDITERPQSPGEEIANSVVHWVALQAAIAAVAFLVAPARRLGVDLRQTVLPGLGPQCSMLLPFGSHPASGRSVTGTVITKLGNPMVRMLETAGLAKWRSQL